MTGSILLASEAAETHALAEAITSMRSAPGGTKQLAAQMDLLTARCQSYPAETRQLWEWFEGQEPCGMVDDLREVFEGHLQLLDERIRLVREVQSLGAEMGCGNGAALNTSALADALNDLVAQRSHIDDIWQRMNAPPGPWPGPHETREERRAAFERGEYEDIETIIARLQAGGSVSKDGPA